MKKETKAKAPKVKKVNQKKQVKAALIDSLKNKGVSNQFIKSNFIFATI